MKYIPVNKGRWFAKVSDKDYKLLSQWTWHLHHGYPVRGKRPQNAMHSFISGSKRKDHRDRNKLNNCRSNLRPCTPHQNSFNKTRIKNDSGYKGVSKLRPGFWTAHIGFKYKLIHLGVFPLAIEAAKAYDKAARKYHGRFASLNFKKVKK